MKHYLNAFLPLFLLFSIPSVAQVAPGSLGTSIPGIIAAGEYSKDISLYRAKAFVMEQVLGIGDNSTMFQVYALSAATSGDLTSLVYKCDEKQKEGLLLAFYGYQWNPAGVRYQAYGFKDLPKTKATELLKKLDDLIEKSTPYLRTDGDNNNVYFKYEDMVFLLYAPGSMDVHLRVFWGDFDSEWNIGSLRKTERRMIKKI